jgi:hypothetical protein
LKKLKISQKRGKGGTILKENKNTKSVKELMRAISNKNIDDGIDYDKILFPYDDELYDELHDDYYDPNLTEEEEMLLEDLREIEAKKSDKKD